MYVAKKRTVTIVIIVTSECRVSVKKIIKKCTLFVDRNKDVVPSQRDSKTRCHTRHTTYT